MNEPLTGLRQGVFCVALILSAIIASAASAQSETKLTASDGAERDAFGSSVSVNGDVAVIGSVQSGSAYVYRFNGSTWGEEQKLTASNGAEFGQFGHSVSVSGDVALIGDFTGGGGYGSAFVYRFDGATWVEEQKLTASDGVLHDHFGFSVSLSGDVALIGAFEDDDKGPVSGSAYVYRFDGATWVEEQKLTASDGAEFDFFGHSVSVSGDVALIGAFQHAGSGSAYVYRFNGGTWVEEQKLTASDGAEFDLFGHRVSVSGDVALIGAFGHAGSGSAYVYRFNGSTWVEEQQLTASDGAESDNFGNSVSVSGDVAVIGSPYDDDKVTESGSAYVYRFNGSTWVEEQKLTASDVAGSDNFGFSVSVSGDVALIGAWQHAGSGSAYVYRFDGATWGEEQKLTASDGAADDNFGNSVSVSGDVAVIGSPYDDDRGTDFGSAYIYDLSGLGVSVEPSAAVPSLYRLRQNYPNPFNPSTTISYALPRPADATVTVYDVLGRQVRELASGARPAGEYEVSFDAGGLPSGVYLYRFQVGDYVETKRMVVAR